MIALLMNRYDNINIEINLSILSFLLVQQPHQLQLSLLQKLQPVLEVFIKHLNLLILVCLI